MSKKTVTIRVDDRRGKYPSKEYQVEVEADSPEFLWYGEPTEKFIKDNNHPPYQPGKSESAYYSRFFATVTKK